MDLDGLYVAIDTTGLPDRVPGWEPRLVGLGIAVVARGVVTESKGGLILQPTDHLHDARARGAWKSNGLSPEAVEAQGEPKGAALAFLAMTSASHGPLRGFNVSFLQHFLRGMEWGPCVMETAAQRIMGPMQERIGLIAALEWALEEGHDVSAPTESHHRAHGNAVRVAKLAIALASVHADYVSTMINREMGR